MQHQYYNWYWYYNTGQMGFVFSGFHSDSSLSMETEAPGVAGVLQLPPPPGGFQQLVLPEQQPADAVLRQPQRQMCCLQTPPAATALVF